MTKASEVFAHRRRASPSSLKSTLIEGLPTGFADTVLGRPAGIEIFLFSVCEMCGFVARGKAVG